MNITLQCHYCGNEDNKLDMVMPIDEINKLRIKCKCGKWLIHDGVMGHKYNAHKVSELSAYGNDCPTGRCET